MRGVIAETRRTEDHCQPVAEEACNNGAILAAFSDGTARPGTEPLAVANSKRPTGRGFSRGSLVMFFGDSEKSIPADIRNVLDAAALLQVSEFCLFQLAYRHWHGSDTSEASIERHFVPYMFRSVVPFWVRQLCRRVLQAAADGTLDPVDFGIEPSRVGEHQPVALVRALAVGGTVVGMLLLACGLFAGY